MSNRLREGRVPPRCHDSPSDSDSAKLSPTGAESPDESSDANRTIAMAGELPRALRKETERRERFDSYVKRRRILTSRLFALAVHYTGESIRTMREQARRYFLAGLR